MILSKSESAKSRSRNRTISKEYVIPKMNMSSKPLPSTDSSKMTTYSSEDPLITMKKISMISKFNAKRLKWS